MILDYNASKQTYFVRVPRADGPVINALMVEHGLDFSSTASTPGEAVLFTREPYAAVSFWEYATPSAREALQNIQTEIEASWSKGSGAHIAHPGDCEPWPFQLAGVEYALRRQNTLIGDQPGLGKTAQAIMFANEIRAKRVLVLCPANIRLQWAKNIRKWSTMPWPYTVYPILNGRNGVHPTAAWTITSYDLARSPAIGRALAVGHYDLLIIDEGHYLKTVDTKRTRAVFGGGENREFEALASRAGSIMALTGTPLPNRPREAYTLARGLCFDAIDFMSEEKFSQRFNPSERKEVVDKTTGRTKFIIDERTGRHGELQSRLRTNFMIRREKHGANGVMDQLNMPEYDIVQAEETSLVKQALAAESLLEIDPENLEGADATILGHIAVVRHQMGLALAPQVSEYVEMLLDGGEEKVVLYGHHIDVLDIFCERLAKYGVLRIDGRLSAEKKQKAVDDFIECPWMRVIVGNLISMGTGTDGLQQVCNHCVFGEADWTPGVNQQGIDRLDRGGQNNTVQADFIVAPGSFSERILATALRKNQTIHKALDRRM